MGWGGVGRKEYKGRKEAVRGNGYTHYLDCSEVFMSEYL